MCSLPVTGPKGVRPVKCSVLFVVDDGALEEVEEGIDYGVRRPSAVQNGANGASSGGGKGKAKMDDEEKFLKGVRVCRDCRAVLTLVFFFLNPHDKERRWLTKNSSYFIHSRRYQYQHDLRRLPQFAKMHRVRLILPFTHKNLSNLVHRCLDSRVTRKAN
jgi:hypothetical protein